MTTKFFGAICLVLFTIQSGTFSQPRAFTKDMRLLHFHSEVMSQERYALVMLPPGYDSAPGKRYPVLYMQDGQSVFANWRIDELAQPLFANGQVEPLIFVAIFNGDTQEERFSDYTPTHDSKFRQSGNADIYGRMIVEELKPVVDSEYRTLPDQPSTAIGGTSLGGLVSLYLALKYPATFGKAAVMSPSVWWDNQVIIRDLKRAAKPSLKIWLDVGSEEGSQSIAETKELRDVLLKKGWKKDSDLKYFEAKGAEHNEKAFARRAPEVLKYLFPGPGITAASRVSGTPLRVWRTRTEEPDEFALTLRVQQKRKSLIHLQSSDVGIKVERETR